MNDVVGHTSKWLKLIFFIPFQPDYISLSCHTHTHTQSFTSCDNSWYVDRYGLLLLIWSSWRLVQSLKAHLSGSLISSDIRLYCICMPSSGAADKTETYRTEQKFADNTLVGLRWCWCNLCTLVHTKSTSPRPAWRSGLRPVYRTYSTLLWFLWCKSNQAKWDETV